jgi:hypothetical protein
MKPKTTELDVDFIGGQEQMTKEEENAISEFLKSRKLLRATKNTQTPKTIKRRKIIV